VLAGDLASIGVVTLFSVVFIGLATYLCVRTLRTWRRAPGAYPHTTRRVLLGTLLVAPVFHWQTWRKKRDEKKGWSVADVATAGAVLAVPVLLLAWGLVWVVRRRGSATVGVQGTRGRHS
jgi:hypothetical protein